MKIDRYIRWNDVCSVPAARVRLCILINLYLHQRAAAWTCRHNISGANCRDLFENISVCLLITDTCHVQQSMLSEMHLCFCSFWDNLLNNIVTRETFLMFLLLHVLVHYIMDADTHGWDAVLLASQQHLYICFVADILQNVSMKTEPKALVCLAVRHEMCSMNVLLLKPSISVFGKFRLFAVGTYII